MKTPNSSNHWHLSRILVAAIAAVVLLPLVSSADNSSSLSFGKNGGTQVVTVPCNGSYQGPLHTEDWLSSRLSLKLSGGVGTLTLTVECEANSGNARTGYIEAKISGDSYKIYVSQDGKNGSAIKPDLSFAIPSGWSESVYLSASEGGAAVTSFAASSPVYLNFCYRNSKVAVGSHDVNVSVYKTGDVISLYSDSETVSSLAAKQGKTFRDWALPANLAAGSYRVVIWLDDGDDIDESDEDNNMTTLSFKVKAATPVKKYQVKFYANGGKGKMAVQKMTYGKAAKLKANKFTRKGWVFLGWAKTKNGKVVYKNKKAVKNLTKKGGTVKLYAKWAKKSYKVKFSANGGKGKMTAQTMTYGKAAKLKANKFKRSGWKFMGWAKTKTGAVAYKNKKSVKNLTTTGSVTLYAVWKNVEDVTWTLRLLPSREIVPADGVIEIDSEDAVLLLAQKVSPTADELEDSANELIAFAEAGREVDGASFSLTAPVSQGGTVSLWSAASGLLEETDVSAGGKFDFEILAPYAWHWLRVCSGDEELYSIWLSLEP